MSRLTRCWLWLSDCFSRRPLSVCGIAAGLLIFIALLSYIFVRQTKNMNSFSELKSSLCRPHQDRLNCQRLLDRLLEHPTKVQIERFRVIIRDGRQR